MMIIPPCFSCKHYGGADPATGVRRCGAFPAGIPRPILDGENDHTRPYPGDRGIRFEADPSREFTPSPDPDLSGFEF